ncbi:unnamed protein product [Sympodiomycopsis kandeliae]
MNESWQDSSSQDSTRDSPQQRPEAMARAGTRGLVSGLLAKLSPPIILSDARWIPLYRETCFPPPSKNDGKGREDTGEVVRSPSPVSWQSHLSKASSGSFTNSFTALLKSYPSKLRSLVFFGEQHHQPEVIRSQVQLLNAMSDQIKRDERHANANGKDQKKRVKYHLHLLMEHFSILDQPMLNSFQSNKMDAQELCTQYYTHSQESFRIEMYLPLLLLAKEKGIPIWGGFPPREWARVVFNNGVDQVKQLEHSRDTESGYKVPPFSAWRNVVQLSQSHRSFLSSLMRPDRPPQFTSLPHNDESAPQFTYSPCHTDIRERYPTELIPPLQPNEKGFGPAQALKDSYLAHCARELLHRGHLLQSPDNDCEQEVEHRNVVMVVAGLGHVESGFGAPERVYDDDDTKQGLIVLSKPKDSALWLGPEWQPSVQRDSPSQDGDAVDQNHTSSQADVGWERKLADAIVLYDWQDLPDHNVESDKSSG